VSLQIFSSYRTECTAFFVTHTYIVKHDNSNSKLTTFSIINLLMSLTAFTKQAVWTPGSADTVCPRPPPTLTFDRLTLKLVCPLHLRWGTFSPNLGTTLGLWVLELFAMYATDRQTGRWTDRRTDKSNIYFPLRYGRGILYCCWHTWSTSTLLCLHQSPGSTFSNFPPSAAELFRLPPHRSGTHYQTQSFRHQHCGRSSTNWKFFYFNDPSFISTVIVVSQ